MCRGGVGWLVMIKTSHLNKVSSEAEILAEWIGRMQQEHLTPDGVTFTTLMQVLFLLGGNGNISGLTCARFRVSGGLGEDLQHQIDSNCENQVMFLLVNWLTIAFEQNRGGGAKTSFVLPIAVEIMRAWLILMT